MQVCERQAGIRSMHIQYSYNSNVNILLVSLLSCASGSLRTTSFHLKKKVFILVYTILVPPTSINLIRYEVQAMYKTKKSGVNMMVY